MFTAAWRSLPSGLLEETVNFSGESLRTKALREGGAGIGCLVKLDCPLVSTLGKPQRSFLPSSSPRICIADLQVEAWKVFVRCSGLAGTP